jgi:hypothetical protein
MVATSHSFTPQLPTIISQTNDVYPSPESKFTSEESYFPFRQSLNKEVNSHGPKVTVERVTQSGAQKEHKRKLQKNAECAKRSRQKKRDAVQDLHAENSDRGDEILSLKLRCERLEREVELYKNLYEKERGFKE